jgi:hypothetical protein
MSCSAYFTFPRWPFNDHRLEFGQSVPDMCSSFAQALSTTMLPKELNYYIPSAQGKSPTCSIQGFLIVVGYVLDISPV